ncbi:MAG: hypothetical protein ACLFU8_17650 [Anaerolineales bacterium]
MSIDVDVIPTLSTVVCWEEVESRLRENLGAAAARLLGEAPQLYALGSDELQMPDDPLSVEGVYYLNLGVQNTLGLSAMSNSSDVDELLYLEDYGRNLDPETLPALAERWREAGHYYAITSFAGRGPEELHILRALAAALAETCRGYVVLMHDWIFDLDVGIYTPEEFKGAQVVAKRRRGRGGGLR